MSVISVFTSQAPTIGGRPGVPGYEFDAVLEDTLDASVQLTGYAIESGARVMDHRIINPIKWTMTGAVSNNPLRTQITDFLGGVVSNLIDNPYAATVAGLAAGFLSGSNETRSSTTLSFLINLMFTGDPFDVDTGDLQLKNMVITRISRAKDPSNENGLIFVAELQELIILDSIGSNGQPKQTQLPKDDPAQTGIAGVIDRGEKLVASVGKAINDQVNTVLGSIF